MRTSADRKIHACLRLSASCFSRNKQLLTLNPPHPLIKKADDELVLRGMAYGTRKSYGQHLRNYFDWLKDQHIEPERATREDIRAYIVQTPALA